MHQHQGGEVAAQASHRLEQQQDGEQVLDASVTYHGESSPLVSDSFAGENGGRLDSLILKEISARLDGLDQRIDQVEAKKSGSQVHIQS